MNTKNVSTCLVKHTLPVTLSADVLSRGKMTARWTYSDSSSRGIDHYFLARSARADGGNREPVQLMKKTKLKVSIVQQIGHKI